MVTLLAILPAPALRASGWIFRQAGRLSRRSKKIGKSWTSYNLTIHSYRKEKRGGWGVNTTESEETVTHTMSRSFLSFLGVKQS